MQSFKDKIAVVTGGGTGMGRELTRQLASEGSDVAICDVSAAAMDETKALCAESSPSVRITTFVADVSDETQMIAFRDHVGAALATAHINLLFNNAGIGGGGSFVIDDRDEWDKVFGVCWGGVYNGTRSFMPMLLASTEGHVVNTSSVNGFWASLGPQIAHTAYSAAKFAVKGFTEALITDFRLNAPHLRASVVMPGHIGTSIAFNSGEAFGRNPKELDDEHIAQMRSRMARQGMDLGAASDEDLRAFILQRAEAFRDGAPTTASEAASIILEGVRNDRWRILVGGDAHVLDEMVRSGPEEAYENSFVERLRGANVLGYFTG